jgi:hypothetical protein
MDEQGERTPGVLTFVAGIDLALARRIEGRLPPVRGRSTRRLGSGDRRLPR